MYTITSLDTIVHIPQTVHIYLVSLGSLVLGPPLGKTIVSLGSPVLGPPLGETIVPLGSPVLRPPLGET